MTLLCKPLSMKYAHAARLSRWWQLKHFWNFHPDPWGNDPFWRAYFSKGLKPPTSYVGIWGKALENGYVWEEAPALHGMETSWRLSPMVFEPVIWCFKWMSIKPHVLCPKWPINKQEKKHVKKGGYREWFFRFISQKQEVCRLGGFSFLLTGTVFFFWIYDLLKLKISW